MSSYINQCPSALIQTVSDEPINAHWQTLNGQNNYNCAASSSEFQFTIDEKLTRNQDDSNKKKSKDTEKSRAERLQK